MIQHKSDVYKQITSFLDNAVKDFNIPVVSTEFKNENSTAKERVEYRISDIVAVGNNITEFDDSGATLLIKNYPYFNFKLVVRCVGKSTNIANYNDAILLHSRSEYLLDYLVPDIDIRGFSSGLPEIQKMINGEVVSCKDIIFDCTVMATIEVDTDEYTMWFDTISDITIQ